MSPDHVAPAGARDRRRLGVLLPRQRCRLLDGPGILRAAAAADPDGLVGCCRTIRLGGRAGRGLPALVAHRLGVWRSGARLSIGRVSSSVARNASIDEPGRQRPTRAADDPAERQRPRSPRRGRSRRSAGDQRALDLARRRRSRSRLRRHTRPIATRPITRCTRRAPSLQPAPRPRTCRPASPCLRRCRRRPPAPPIIKPPIINVPLHPEPPPPPVPVVAGAKGKATASHGGTRITFGDGSAGFECRHHAGGARIRRQPEGGPRRAGADRRLRQRQSG